MNNTHHDYRSGQMVVWVVVGLIILGLLVLFSLPLLTVLRRPFEAAGVTQTTRTSEPENEQGVTAAEMVDNPVIYEGFDVTIEGVIADWVTKRAFLIPGAAQGFSQADMLLVIANADFPNPELVSDDILAVGDNTLVQAYGTAGVFRIADAERILGFTLDPELFEEYEDEAVLYASRAREIEEKETEN